MQRRELLKAGLLASGILAACAGPSQTEEPGSSQVELPNLTRDLADLPIDEYESRIERLRKQVAEDGLAGFVMESGTTLQYFTGASWSRSERPFIVVAGPSGSLVCIVPAFEEDRAREQFRFEVDVRTWEEDVSAYEVVEKALADLGIRTGRIAVEPTTRLFIQSGLTEAAPGVDFVNGAAYSERCRLIKSSREIEYIRVADRITKNAYDAALSDLWEGISEDDLAEKVADAHRQQGSRGGAMVLFGMSSALPHGSNQVRKLRVGDVLLMDGGCSVHGYKSDVTRSMVFGEPSDLQKRVWDIVFEAQSAALKTIRPGVTCGDVDAAARKVIVDAGYGPDYRFFTHRLGHGVGLDGHEPPYMVRGNPVRLEPGMVFSVEPGVYIQNQWGIRHEDVVVVTEDGVEVLGNRSSNVSV